MEVERASSPEFEEDRNKMETVKTVRFLKLFIHYRYLFVKTLGCYFVYYLNIVFSGLMLLRSKIVY